ncbi:hypothetical protein [Nocardia wallacei]|uniref:hypothetical protein n=1 Tax=Nocardia wallacei TaxID=480035 RepID=UPI00245844A5|nr:hypothetical protein [Nocardia wallacei]
MDPTVSPQDSARPPILARLHHIPTAQGLTIPFVTLCHRGGRMPVWGALDPENLHAVRLFALCQVCGEPFADRVVVMVRPADWLLGLASEPGLHPECAHYSTLGCPVLAGRMTHYRSRPPASRLTRCGDPQCRCATWKPPAPDGEDELRAGKPMDAWYAVWIDREDYRIVERPADDNGPQLVGVLLRGVPLRAIHKVRDATADPGKRTMLDALADHLAVRRLTGRQQEP